MGGPIAGSGLGVGGLVVGSGEWVTLLWGQGSGWPCCGVRSGCG